MHNQRDNQSKAELYGVGAGALTLFGGAVMNGITIPTMTWGTVLGSGSITASFTFWSTVVSVAPVLIPLAFGVGGAVYLAMRCAEQLEVDTTESSSRPGLNR
jgi:hypothetical protein